MTQLKFNETNVEEMGEYERELENLCGEAAPEPRNNLCAVHFESNEAKQSFVCPLAEIINPVFYKEGLCAECFQQLVQNALEGEAMTRRKRAAFQSIVRQLA